MLAFIILTGPTVIQFAKKTGDYAVLSHADICVLALTHTLQLEENAVLEKQKQEVSWPFRCVPEAYLS